MLVKLITNYANERGEKIDAWVITHLKRGNDVVVKETVICTDVFIDFHMGKLCYNNSTDLIEMMTDDTVCEGRDRKFRNNYYVMYIVGWWWGEEHPK